LGGEVKDGRGSAHGRVHTLGIADIRGLDLDAIAVAILEPMRVLVGAKPRKIVEEENAIPTCCQRIRKIASDKSAAPGYENRPRLPVLDCACRPHATSPRRSSSAVARSTRSSAAWPDSH
jgi:hypothetical protein